MAKKKNSGKRTVSSVPNVRQPPSPSTPDKHEPLSPKTLELVWSRTSEALHKLPEELFVENTKPSLPHLSIDPNIILNTEDQQIMERLITRLNDVESIATSLSERFHNIEKREAKQQEREDKQSDFSQKLTEQKIKQDEEKQAAERELDEKRKVLSEEHKQLESKRRDIQKEQLELNERHESMLERERDADNGFAFRHAHLLANLDEQISKKNDYLSKIIQGIDEESRIAKTRINADELELAKQKQTLDHMRRQLDAKDVQLRQYERDLESDRKRFYEEARREVASEMDDLNSRNKKSEESYNDLRDRWEKAKRALNDFEELRAELDGRSPRSVLDDLHRLQNEMYAQHDRDYSFEELDNENQQLRRQLRDLNEKLAELQRSHAEANHELSMNRMGVSEKENLEREKAALEGQVKILGLHLGNLRKEIDDLTGRNTADCPFPQMTWMQGASREDWIEKLGAHELERRVHDVPDLKTFCADLQHRVAVAEQGGDGSNAGGPELRFRLKDIRLFVAGLAMSKLHILQGISGTGKTSLAKAFAKAMGGFCTDIAVQAGWRDRDDLLGNYNAFEKRFHEKDCLQALYRAQCGPYRNRLNIILLDEMNLSRPEQYFSEFLSALEKNSVDDRTIALTEWSLPGAPQGLVDGRSIRVPPNVWFIGTANHDESTNEFADKTYDRAHIMELHRHDEHFEIHRSAPVAFSLVSLEQKFDEACNLYHDDVEDLIDTIHTGTLTSTLEDTFGISWGNRFSRQTKRFIPVFMASGNEMDKHQSALQGLDHLLATRVLRRGRILGRIEFQSDDIEFLKEALLDTLDGWRGLNRKTVGNSLSVSLGILDKELDDKQKQA